MIITGGSALWLARQACPAPRIRGNLLILVCCNCHLPKNVRVFYYMGALLSCLGSQTPVFLFCCPSSTSIPFTAVSLDENNYADWRASATELWSSGSFLPKYRPRSCQRDVPHADRDTAAPQPGRSRGAASIYRGGRPLVPILDIRFFLMLQVNSIPFRNISPLSG